MQNSDFIVSILCRQKENAPRYEERLDNNFAGDSVCVYMRTVC